MARHASLPYLSFDGLDRTAECGDEDRQRDGDEDVAEVVDPEKRCEQLLVPRDGEDLFQRQQVGVGDAELGDCCPVEGLDSCLLFGNRMSLRAPTFVPEG